MIKKDITKKTVLEIQNLCVKFADKVIIKDLSLSIRQREIFCLIGESGSGKSMTASAIMKLLPSPSLSIHQGRILLNGQDLVQCTEQQMRKLRGQAVSMVFQEPMTALNPLMRVGRQISEVISVHSPSLPEREVRQRVLELMRDVHLPTPETLINSYPHQLSGGQRQRIVIAMAIALDPILIIADEPTTALDVTTQAQVLHLFRELQQKHDSGILFITHDFEVVREIADSVAVMQAGEIVEMGSAESILNSPQHPYTQSLLAAIPHGTPKPDHPVTNNTLLELRNVCLTYDNKSLLGTRRVTHAVKNISLALEKGETLGIVGESGSGKSSLGRCITMSNSPTEGQILYAGENLTSLKGGDLLTLRRRIQMIFQDPYRSLNPRRKIRDALIEGPVEAGKNKTQAILRAIELLELVGLPANSMDRYPHQFSGGQRQRICIARALAMDPELVIADEAVSALDVSVQSQVLELFDDLQKKLGFTMIFITHDLRVATQLCNRIAVMRHGELVELNTASNILNQPQHAYTKQLFDAVPGEPWAQAS